MANNPKIEVEIGARITELKDKLRETDRELEKSGKSFNKLNKFATGALQGIGARITELKDKLRETYRELEKSGKSFNKLNEFATGALQGIAAAFTVGAVVNFGKAVLDTTAKFQKFEAVLTNTLGSSSEAQLALIQIQDFASKTPFAVDELTQSFVKLANQGFKPTIQELRSLGDLAASTGKSFDQLAEAIIDAQVGEFERLKEFGIRAKVQGDQVTFTFKGVETQVKNTSEAIKGYVLTLGDAEGVSGAMAGISGTLGGKISNLGDNIDQLKLAIGDQTSGVFAASIDWLNEFISLATSATKSLSDIRQEVIDLGDAQTFSETRKEVDFLVDKLSETLPLQEAINRAVDLTKESYQNLSDDISKGFISGGLLSKQLKELEAYREELFKVSENTKTSGNELKKVTIEAEKLKRVFEDINKLPSIGLPGEGRKELADRLRARREQLQSGGQVGQTGQELIDSALAGVKSQGIFTSLPIQEFSNVANEVLENVKLQVEDLSGAFTGLGAVIGSAFKNPQLGTFLGQFAQFVTKIIAGAFAVSKANAIAGATQSSLFSGPAAVFTLPAFIAGAVGLVASAFSGIGGGSGGVSGVGTSGISQGTSFTGQGGGATGFNRDLTLRGEFRIDGNDLVYVIDQSRASQI